MSKPLDAVGTGSVKISLSDESPAVRNAMKRFNDALTIKRLEQRVAELERDAEMLDWLEQRRLALNQHYDTNYGWKFVSSCNVNRLLVGDVNTIDLHDSAARGKDIRTAIRRAMNEKT